MQKGNAIIAAGVALLLTGALVIPLALMLPVADAPDEALVFATPGQASLEILEPGRFYLWHYHRTRWRGEAIDRDEHLPDDLEIELRDANGRAIAWEPRTSVRTDFGGEETRSIGYFDAPEAGLITANATGGDGRIRIVSIERFAVGPWFRAIGLSTAALVVLGAAGVVLIVTGVRIRRAERPARS